MASVPMAVRMLVERRDAIDALERQALPCALDRWREQFPLYVGALDHLSDPATRRHVRTACAEAATSEEAAAAAFVAVMTWGYGTVGYGRYRTSRMLQSGGPRRLHDAAIALCEIGVGHAYRRLSDGGRDRIAGLGPAFGTKFLYFVQPLDGRPRALILDRVVASWLGQYASIRLDPWRWDWPTYERYIMTVAEWASTLGCEPDLLELLLFEAGRREVVRARA